MWFHSLGSDVVYKLWAWITGGESLHFDVRDSANRPRVHQAYFTGKFNVYNGFQNQCLWESQVAALQPYNSPLKQPIKFSTLL